jgi:hypothetical protein
MLWVAFVLMPFCKQQYSTYTPQFRYKHFFIQLLANNMTKERAGQKLERTDCKMIEEPGAFPAINLYLKKLEGC